MLLDSLATCYYSILISFYYSKLILFYYSELILFYYSKLGKDMSNRTIDHGHMYASLLISHRDPLYAVQKTNINSVYCTDTFLQ